MRVLFASQLIGQSEEREYEKIACAETPSVWRVFKWHQSAVALWSPTNATICDCGVLMMMMGRTEYYVVHYINGDGDDQ